MKVLILGGTSFVGRTIVEDLQARGHTPTLFNRGRTGAELFPGVDRLIGDRDTGDYEALRGRSWDAVVDVSGYVPRQVEQALAALGERFARYVFISTGMVYDHRGVEGEITEASPRLAAHHGAEVLDGDTYGPMKVACEDLLLAQLGDRLSVVRPGWVVGPHERAGLLTYWVRRAAGTGSRGGPRTAGSTGAGNGRERPRPAGGAAGRAGPARRVQRRWAYPWRVLPGTRPDLRRRRAGVG